MQNEVSKKEAIALQQAEGVETVEIGNRIVPIIPDVPRNAIPPLDFPIYEENRKSIGWLDSDDMVLGVEFNGDARAYPLKLMNWHEIVNDTVGGVDIVITYCPLCRSGIVFDRHLGERVLSFGNTGALFESSLVMYDRETESYWHQVGGEAITGELTGSTLTVLPSFLTTWEIWRSRYPQTKILSIDTGYSRPYLGGDIYEGYDEPNSPPGFPVSIVDNRLPPKEKIIGIVVDGQAKAYPVQFAKNTILVDSFAGENIEVTGDKTGQSAQMFFTDGVEHIPAPIVSTFWFAWFAAHPDTEIFFP